MRHKTSPGIQTFLAFLLSAVFAAGLFYRLSAGEGLKMNTRSRESIAMDTVVRVSVTSDKTPEELDGILDGVFELIERLDGKLSMHNATSEISLVNANAGREAVRVSPETAEVLRSALEITRLTDGAFDPTIGPVTALWQAGDAKKTRHELPSDSEILEALSLVDGKSLKETAPNEFYLAREGMRLDLGGIAKGYVSAAVRNFLESAGVESALIDLGGNVLAVGSRPNGEPWRIGVQHPLQSRGAPICSMSVENASVITAGVYERFVEIGGKRYTHIFDPRTGRPIEGNLLSVSVVAADPTIGDALSTAFMVMGENRSKLLLKELPGVETVFVSDKGSTPTVTATGGIIGLKVLNRASVNAERHEEQR
ncbi:MAG: FAD:protein FMN transferase [Synergistaceae bacterium]|jgi:thiamine biosynthesis lipoprotein|nr:FAD:protein FMN transferase [Synergistaceae bacterium]